MIDLLLRLGEKTTAPYLNNMLFHCHVNVIADGLSEWLTITLTFDDLMEELCTYHITNNATSSTIDFSVYPFLDDKML